MNLIEEMTLRGMIHQKTEGVEELLKTPTCGYVGFDPTSDSLHVGSLMPLMVARLFKKYGHQPLILLGGATAAIGDPSGKSTERTLMSREDIEKNKEEIEKQIKSILGSDTEFVDNYTWMKDFSFLDFIRDVGKNVTINYMMSKDSVSNRLENGMSFTEFTYQLVQGYDFLHLYNTRDCKIQLSGSDQWGNGTTGTTLISKQGGKGELLTSPLVTKSDGSKFGKTESGTIFLDPKKTSPYKFYQFWLNCSDQDATTYIKYFSTSDLNRISEVLVAHSQNPEQRILQKELAKDVTILVHGEQAYLDSVKASELIFNKDVKLTELSESTISMLMNDIPSLSVPKGTPFMDALVLNQAIFKSKSEARTMIGQNALKINKETVSDIDYNIESNLAYNRFLFVQKGKKNFYLVELV